MSRRSAAVGGGAFHGFNCDACWMGFNTLTAATWQEAEAEAVREGWRFTGVGSSERDLCGSCAGGWLP